MTTVDTVFLIITACALSLFFLLGSVAAAMTIGLLKKVKRIVGKAETAINTAEEAAEVLKNASGKMAAVKLIHNIINLVNRK